MVKRPCASILLKYCCSIGVLRWYRGYSLFQDAADGRSTDSVGLRQLAERHAAGAIAEDGGTIQIKRAAADVTAFDTSSPHAGADPLNDQRPTRLWDKHLPLWREQHAKPKEALSKEAEEALVKLINRFEKDSTPIDATGPVAPEEIAQMTIQRRVLPRKGKWKRFPPEVELTAHNTR